MKNNKIYSIKKSFRLFFFLVLFFSVSLFPENIAQLEQKIKQAPDSEKSALLNRLSEVLKKSAGEDKVKEKLLHSANQALKYAKKFGQKDREFTALNNIVYAYDRLKEKEKALEFAKKSLSFAKKRKDKPGIISTLNTLGILYSKIPDFEKALATFQEKRAASIEAGDKKSEAESLHQICNGYCFLGKYKKAIPPLKEALKLFQSLDQSSFAVLAMENLGAIHSKLGRKEEALVFFLKGKDLAEEKGLDYRAGRIYLSISSFYKGLENIEKSSEYNLKAVAAFKKANRQHYLATAYQNQGELLKKIKEYDRALDYLNRALKIILQKEIHVYNSPSEIIFSIGEVHFKKGEYPLALKKYNEALEFALKDKDLDLQARCHRNMGEVYLNLDNLQAAYINLTKSRQMAEKSNDLALKRDNYELLSAYYEKKGNYKKSLVYHRLFAELKFEVFNKDNAKIITEMQTKYESEKKEKEIELLKKDSKIHDLTLSRQRLTRNVSIAGFVLILLFMVYFVKKYHYLLSFWKKKHYISRYKLMDKIGSGGMGVVYKAHEIQDKTKTFAIKVLREEYFDDDTQQKRFKQEAMVTHRLDHPNIVKIFERGESGGNLYIAMELLQGRTLEDKILEEGQLDTAECIHIMAQVFEALLLIHSKDIIHRDLKPANIMLVTRGDNTNFVKLMDFGLARAKFQTRLTRTGILVGTTNYLPPEQITNSGISPASDIFSSGVIFYEIVCGIKPFLGESESDTIMEIIAKIPLEPKVVRPGIPPALNSLIKKMLAKEKEKRPGVKEILKILKKLDSSA